MYTKRIMAFAVAGLFLFILALGGCGKKDMLLEYRMPKGEEVKYKIKTTDSATSSMSGGPSATKPGDAATTNQVKQILEAEISQKVKDVDKEGIMTIEVTYNNFKLTVERDGKSQEIPTAAMEGKSVTMKMNKRGKIIEMEGEDGSATTGSMNQMNQTNAIFPEKAVKLGETWENKDNKTEIPIPGVDAKIVQNIESTFTLDSIEKVDKVECAKISMKSTVTQKTEKQKPKSTTGSGNTTPPPPAVSIEGKGEGKVSGTIYFALNHGKIVKYTSEMTMTNAMTLSQGSRKQSTTNKMQRSMTMELIK
jgi:hypothetical protein